MTQSNDLLETAQSGVARIVEQHVQGEVAARSGFRISTFGFLAAFVLFFLVNLWVQSGLEGRMREPAPSTINLSIVPLLDNPMLCPGDTLEYTVTAIVNGPAVVDADAVIRNLDESRTEIFSNTQRNLYGTPSKLVTRSHWKIPDMLPASILSAEHQWKPGNYRRVIAITNVANITLPSIAHVDFRIGNQCPNVQK